MSVGRRRLEEQSEFWVATDQLGRGPRNAFYDKLNEERRKGARSEWHCRLSANNLRHAAAFISS